MAQHKATPGHPERTLKRSLTLPLITFYGLGNILGAGIYVLTGKVVARLVMGQPEQVMVLRLLP